MGSYLASQLEAIVVLVLAFAGVLWHAITVHFRVRALENQLKARIKAEEEIRQMLATHVQESTPVRIDVAVTKQKVENIETDVKEIKNMVREQWLKK